MTMTFSFHESIDPTGAIEHGEMNQFYSSTARGSVSEGFRFFRDKLRIPPLGPIIDRPRIATIMKRSIEQFPATLVTGRAGTGKTALAAAFALQRENVSWYSVDSSDGDWPVFSRYFAKCAARSLGESYDPAEADVAKFLADVFAAERKDATGGKELIILDGVHHIFDAEWFDQFFQLLLFSLPSDTHLIVLCRSKPPSPLWRLRSKQMLNVLDEKVISFTPTETEELFRSKGLPAAAAREVHHRYYGRISKLIQAAEKLRSGPTQ